MRVWSTRLKAASMARVLTSCRTTTTSLEERIGRTSLFSTGTGALVCRGRFCRELRRLVQERPQERHSPLDVERGAYPGQRQAELDERDRHRRLHPRDDGVRVEHA